MAVTALNKQVLHCRLANYWLLLLSIDLATLVIFQTQGGLCLSPFGSLTSLHVLAC